jgi:autotransporter-associated beta strand protein
LFVQSPPRFLVAFLSAKRWLCALSLILIESSILYGQDTWLGPTNGSWFTPTNWSLGAPPTSTQTAFVTNGTISQIAATGAVATTLTIGTPGSTVQLLPGGSLSVTNVLIDPGGTLRFSGGVNTGGTLSAVGIQNNGAILFDGSSDHVMNIPVTGSGNYIMAGTGILTVNAKMGDSPNVLVNAGVLRINFSGAITNGNISVNGGTAQIAATGEVVSTLTIGTAVAGSTLQMLSGGGLTVNSPVIIGTGGTLRFSGGGNSGGTLFANAIQNNGNIVFDGSLDHTLNAVVTGSGNLTMAGTGTLALNAQSSYSGVTTISAGTVQVGSTTALSPNSAFTVNSTLNLNGFSNEIGSLSGTGTVLNNGARAATLTVGNDNSNSTFSGVLADGQGGLQLTKVGSGALTLTGANTYIGTTTINSGSLIVDGSIASAQTLVNSGGFLGGHGTIGGNVVNSGIVGQFNSPGTLTITGNYTQNPGGTLQIQIAGLGTGQHDLLAVNGHANLAGNLQLVRRGGFNLSPGDHILFLTANNGVSGNFSNVQNGFVGTGTIVQGQVIALSNGVVLQAKQGSFATTPGVAITPNNFAVAKALDSAAGDPREAALFAFLNSQPLANLPHDLNLIAPTQISSVNATSVSVGKVQVSNVGQRLNAVRGGSTGFSSSGFGISGAASDFGDGFAGVSGPEGKSGPSVLAPVPENRWGVFLTGLGEFTNVDSTSNAPGYDVDTGGFTLGVDYRLTPNFAIGLFGGYAHTNVNLVGGGNIDVNGGKIGLYTTIFGNGFYLDAAVSGGPSGYNTRRVALQGNASGTTDGSDLNVLVAGGYDWKIGNLSIGPTAGFQFSYVGLDSFTETGSLAPLKFPDQNTESERTAFGGKASYQWKVGHITVISQVTAAWEHEYGSVAYSVVANFASGAGTSFTVSGPEIGRDGLLIGAGVSVLWSDRISTYIYYDGEVGRTNYESHNISGGIRVTF